MRQFKNHKTWGNEIGWRKMPNEHGVGKLAGWSTPRPENGDEFVGSTVHPDGTQNVYVLSEVEHLRDPRDMFFATATYIRADTFESPQKPTV